MIISIRMILLIILCDISCGEEVGEPSLSKAPTQHAGGESVKDG